MATVDPGTVIEIGTCSGCGNPVHIKANKNQIAYYFCTPNDMNNGQGCSHHEKWGRVASNRKLRAFWDAKKAHERKGFDDDRTKRMVAGGNDKPADKEQPEIRHEPKPRAVDLIGAYLRS